MGEIDPEQCPEMNLRETPLTEEQQQLAWQAANLIYRAMRIKVCPTRAYTAAVMWDELTRKHARTFVPTLMRPAQTFMVAQLRAIASRRLQELQDSEVPTDEIEVAAAVDPPADTDA